KPSWQISLTPDALLCSAIRLKARLWLAVQASESIKIRRSIMKRTVKGALIALSAIGLFASATAAAQQRSTHVLQDAATGKIQPARITLQPAPDAAPITKTMPFFSAG